MTRGRGDFSRHLGTVSGLTLLSRVTGLLRDMVIAYAFGTAAVADVFYVAFRIPNLMRRLLAEGAFTMAFVPIYAEYRQRSEAEAKIAANTIFSALVVLLLVLVAIGILATPWLVRVTAYGFVTHPEKFALTVSLTRWMFPYLLLVSLTALMAGMLNSWRHFVAPAAAPMLLNLCMMLGAIGVASWFTQPVYGLAVGVVCGGVAQLLLQIPPLWRRHIIPQCTLAWRHPSLRQLIRIMIPAAYGGAVYQLNVLIITLLASFLPEGSVSYLWYADRITEFPLGIFAVAIATVSLPTLSEQHGAADHQAFIATINRGLRIAFAIALPAAVGIIMLATPIVRLLFEGGAFTAASTAGTVGALICFAAGIPFVSSVRNIVPAFYAAKDPMTPVRIATITIAINAGGGWLLMQRWQHMGLAAAMVLASIAQCLLLLWALRRKLGPLGGCRLLRSGTGSAAATLLMALLLWGGLHVLPASWLAPRARLLPVLLGLILVAVVVYMGALRCWNRDAYRHCVGMLRRSRTPS